ncbi:MULTISPECIES: response regulator [Sphingobacterium]|uniref:response regulator n=1 Tax=Sphingobacterium TaxID=28453 RepID=UPI0013DD846C|nr:MULTISPECIES: response regulator [unclassified Sphingobacterium]
MRALILVIEDNEEICESIVNILRLGNYEVIAAHNGKDGVELASKHKPNLILCDIIMPELDGYGVLHILSKHPDTTGTPFVFLTAKAELSDVRKGMNMGADDYLTKPFDGIELLTTVELRLKKSEQLKMTFANKLNDIDDFLDKTSDLNEFQTLASNRPRKSYKKKDHIFVEGQFPTELYYIIRGEVKTSRLNYDGKELVTGIHREGQFFGYVPLLKGTAYTESAVALQDTVTGTIWKEDFLSLTHMNREVAARFIKILSNNVFDTEKRLLELAYQSVRQRVASALVYLYEHQRVAEMHLPLITVARKDIAGMVGTAVESLNRTLGDFRDESLILLTENGIKILNLEKVKKHSQ